MLDWGVVAVYGLVTLAIGLWYTRRASQGTTEYFLGGRQISWWMLGTSLVAPTFSTDTPNLVTDMVRTGGVSQNWLWWAFVVTGMTTVFVYDGYPGGAGFAQHGFDIARTWLTATRDLIRECRCRDGCLSCIQSPKCGNGNNPLDKLAAVRILTELLRNSTD